MKKYKLFDYYFQFQQYNMSNKKISHILIVMLLILIKIQPSIILAHSNASTLITLPNTQTATLAAGSFSTTISQDSTAKWIWYGNGTNQGCPMNITISQMFQIKCLNLNLYLYITCHSQYTAYINGNTIGSGNNYNIINTWTINTRSYQCGQNLNLTIYAQNNGVSNCSINPAGVIFSLVSNNCPSCTTTQFFDSSVCGCSKCSTYISNCNSCTSGTNCISCISTGYLLTSPITCQLCNVTLIGCNTCSSATVCTACDTVGNFILSGNTCICTSTYGLNGIICELCNSTILNCYTCTSISTCSTCVSGYTLNSSYQCQKCNVSLLGCNICSNTQICTSCDTSGNFVLTSAICSCSTGYTILGSICINCESVLLGCVACTSVSICTSCNATGGFLLVSGSCICNSGWTLSANNCVKCNASLIGCLACTSVTSCFSCDTINHFYLINNNCECSDGYILGGTNCVECSSYLAGCLNCSSTSICTLCDISNKFYLNSDNCLCNSGYILNAGNCFPCSNYIIGCLTCSSTSICTSCDTSGYFVLSGGLCSCQSGYTLVGSTCIACNSSLIGCITCSSTTLCTACNTSNYFQLSAGSCSCASGYIIVSSSCYSCSNYMVGCQSCTSINTCSTCNTSGNFILVSNNCNCNTGYAINGTSCQTCQTTLVGCINCASINSCSICNITKNFYLSGNICVCSNGYYLYGSDCLVCDSNCVTCNSLSTYCLSCSMGLFLNSSKNCQTCTIGCLSCTSLTSCLNCNTANNFILSADLCICTTGYTLSGSSCQYCNLTLIGCLSCTSLTTCVSCDSQNYFNLDGSICSCQTGYYLSGSSCLLCDANCLTCSVSSTNCTSCVTGSFINATFACQSCSIGCLACISPDSCTVCDSSLYLNLSNGNCVCSIGYINQSSSCQTCSSFITGCSICTDTVTCISCLSSNHFSLSGSVCVCNNGYYLAGSLLIAQCLLCDISCETCSISATNCGNCASGYFLNSTSKCQSCPIGCLICSSSAACTSCNIADNFQLSALNCVCSSGYILNNSICSSCSSIIFGCSICSSASICTICNTTNSFMLVSSICQCISGYFLNFTKNCQVCASGCLNCTSLTACTDCINTNYLSLSSGICVCSSGYVFNNSQCQQCNLFLNGCANCTSTNVCTACYPSTQLILSINGICNCPDGYYMDGSYSNSQCLICDSNCITCINSATNCLSCAIGLILNSTNNCQFCVNGTLIGGICVCNNGTYLDAIQQICVACDITCLTCSSNVDCLTCNISQFRELDGTTCICINNYYQQSPINYPVCTVLYAGQCLPNFFWNESKSDCDQICGDGILLILQCDDGNTINGDGCSSTCSVQINYLCVNGSVSTPSICGFNNTLEFMMISQIKSISSNSIIFQISVSPDLGVIASLPNLYYYFSTNLSNSSIQSASYSNSILTITLSYNSTIQQLPCSITLSGSINYQNLFAVQPSTIAFIISPTNNQAAVYYSDSVYEITSSILVAVTVTQGVSLSSFFIGMFLSKTVAIQLINIMQFAYIQMSTVRNANPVLSTLTSMQYINGYNKMNIEFTAKSKSAVELSYGVQSIKYHSHFIQNFNCMYIIMIFFFLCGIIFKFVTFVLGKHKQTLNRIVNFFLKEFVFYLLYFNINNISFGFGIHCKYLSNKVWPPQLIGSWIVALICIFFCTFYIINFIKTLNNFGQFTLNFKPDQLSQLYSPMFIILRALKGFLTGFWNDTNQICYVLFILQFCFVVYVIIKRPFVKSMENLNSIINQLVLLCIVLVFMYYRNFGHSYELIPAYIMMVGMMISLIISSNIFFYSFYLRFCQKELHKIIMMEEHDDKIFDKQNTNTSNTSNATAHQKSDIDSNLRIWTIQNTNYMISDQSIMPIFKKPRPKSIKKKIKTAQRNSVDILTIQTTQHHGD